MKLAPSSPDLIERSERVSSRGAAWQHWINPQQVVDSSLDDSATLNVQTWLARFPWRLTAGWVTLAAFLASGWPGEPSPLDWPRVVLLLLLVDPLWGAIWRLANGRRDLLLLPGRTMHAGWLPYLTPGSPAAELLGHNTGDTLPVIFRIALPTAVLAILVASTLGMAALVMTLAVILAAALGWISTRRPHGGRRRRVPVFMHSVVTVGLPWLLSLRLLGIDAAHEKWPAYMGFVLLWTLHNWGEGRSVRFGSDRLGTVALVVADAGLAILLIVLRSPLWLALWVVLALPTWLAAAGYGSQARNSVWWLLALLAGAAALGQGIW